MKSNVMKATVSGTTCEGKPFTEPLVFTMVPPSDSNHYGTGYYMTVKTPAQTHLIDVRYERTTDVEILADRWIKNWYGKNAQEVIKEHCDFVDLSASTKEPERKPSLQDQISDAAGRAAAQEKQANDPVIDHVKE